MTTAPTRPITDWVIRAIDISRTCKPWEDPVIPGTEHEADDRADAETHLPAIRAIVAEYARNWAIPIGQIRIIAVEFHGIVPAGTVIYSPITNPVNEFAELRALALAVPHPTGTKRTLLALPPSA
ncbi:hypothetical protein [Kitasatospora sp. NPDC058478]|uniref:hypothetical protein n=1 Tax=unclassified Kitasatospora TaxID=2633591 RepID=UPI003663591E